MTQYPNTAREERLSQWIDRLQQFFDSGTFAAFALALLFLIDLLIVTVLLLPKSLDGLGAFAQDFKVWCFGYNPETGQFDMGYIASFIAVNSILVSACLLMWWGPLRSLLRSRRLIPPVCSAFLLVSTAAMMLFTLNKPAARNLSFPAKSLRTSHVPPVIQLLNQQNRLVRLASMRGKVVIITGVYGTCGYTCPMILAQVKRVIAKLSPAQKKHLHVLAITLDPKRDQPPMLAKMAEAHQVKAPFFNFLTGKPALVNKILDRLGFVRKLDPKTKVINHNNLFLLIDRSGRIAYRFSLGKQQEKWLLKAIGLLIQEKISPVQQSETTKASD